MANEKICKIFSPILLAIACATGAGVGFPHATIPATRFATGFTFDYIGGHLHDVDVSGNGIIAEEIPNLGFSKRGVSAFVTYGLANSLNLGIDVGIRDVDVIARGEYLHPDLPDQVVRFNIDGKIGIAAGAHAKLATPHAGGVFGLIGTVRGLWFYSEGKTDMGSYHSGLDLSGTAGFSFRVKNVGFVSFGAKYFEIIGENGIHSYVVDGQRYGGVYDGNWSNETPLGGFIAFDFFPKTDIKRYAPFFSFEFSFFPTPDRTFYGPKPRVRNVGLTMSVGGVSRSIRGDREEVWRP